MSSSTYGPNEPIPSISPEEPHDNPSLPQEVLAVIVPYIITPRWARLLQRAFFGSRYLLLGVAGFLALFQPEALIHSVGWVLVIGAWVALIGVSTGRFHLELIPIWFLIAGLVMVSGVLFGSHRISSGILVLALVPALAERLLHLMLVASRARHTPDEGDGHGDD